MIVRSFLVLPCIALVCLAFCLITKLVSYISDSKDVRSSTSYLMVMVRVRVRVRARVRWALRVRVRVWVRVRVRVSIWVRAREGKG